MSSIEKSPLIRMQEAQLNELEQEINQVRKTIKSLKTRLTNTQDKIETIQRNAFNSVAKLEERLRSVEAKIRQITQKLKTDKRLAASARQAITEVVDLLFHGLGLDGENREEHFREQAEAREKAQSHDAFAQFRVAPDKEENKDIRKLYLELSKQFHPDKASSPADKKFFQQLQQQIIEAYELSDYQALLDLQNMHQDMDTADRESIQEATDVLARKITLRQQQLQHLELQKDRLSLEIKALRKSEMGQMLTDVDSMARAGASLEESLGIDEMENMIHSLEQYHEALVDTDHLGYLSPKFDELFAAQQGGAMEEMEEFMAAMGISPEEAFDMFEGFDVEEELYNPNPRFTEDSLVELTKGFQLIVQDGLGNLFYEDADGLSGVVEETLLDVNTNKPIYTIRLDSRSLKKLSPDYCLDRVEEEEEIDVILEIPEKNLKKKVKKRRESFHTQRKTAIKLELQYQFGHLSASQLQLLQQILTTDVEVDPASNWLAYLSAHAPLPLQVITKETTRYWKAGKTAKIHGAVGFVYEEGLLVIAEIGRKDYEVPLHAFSAKKGDALGEVLDLYRIWLDREQQMGFYPF